jgi:hypothetical protein
MNSDTRRASQPKKFYTPVIDKQAATVTEYTSRAKIIKTKDKTVHKGLIWFAFD